MRNALGRHDLRQRGRRLTLSSERRARLVATPAVACLLLVASQLPLTGSGLGSSLGSVEAAALAEHSGDERLRWGGRLLIAVFASGIVLGPMVVIPRRWAAVVWSVAAAAVFLAGAALLGLLGGQSGSAVVLVALGGLIAVIGGLVDRRRSARLPTGP